MQKYIYIHVYPRLKRLINTLFLASPHYTVFRYDGPVYLLYVNAVYHLSTTVLLTQSGTIERFPSVSLFKGKMASIKIILKIYWGIYHGNGKKYEISIFFNISSYEKLNITDEDI